MSFSTNVYKALKWITLIAIPAFSSLYFGLASIWGFPYGEEVVGTLAIIATFLGALIGVSTSNYYKNAGNKSDGAIIVESMDDLAGSSYIQFEKDIEELKNQDKVTLDILTVDSKNA